jgi:HD-like signal output (HDOD) protein
MPESITALIAARVERADFKLPVFNPVALEIHKAIQNNADLKEIEQLILRDQALASEILRVANSAFFAGLAKQTSIQQALVRIGLNRVLSAIMLAAQKQAFTAHHPFLAQVMVKLWQHAAASAGACRWVALKAGYRDLAESAFLSGLLHDLGSLVILKVLDDICRGEEAPELTESVILEVIDTLHGEYGHRVMLSWQLPPEYALIARDHMLPGFDANNTLITIVRLVDAACRKVGIGMVSEADVVLEALPESQSLGIKDVHLAELEIELEEMVEQFG